MPLLERREPERASAAHAGTKILLIDGHGEARPQSFGAQLCDAYADGAYHGGWPLLRLDARSLGSPAALDAIRWASQIILVFPLWGDQAPAPLQALFCRYAARAGAERAARMVITMDLPAFAHRAVLRGEDDGGEMHKALSLPSLECREHLFIGSSEHLTPAQRREWLDALRQAGALGR